MALYNWIGADSEDWTDAKNWRLQDGTELTTPVGGDSIWLLESTKYALKVNVDRSSGNPDFERIVVGPRYNHNLASFKEPLTCGADFIQINFGDKKQQAWIKQNASLLLDKIVVDSGRLWIKNTANAVGVLRVAGVDAHVMTDEGTYTLVVIEDGELFGGPNTQTYNTSIQFGGTFVTNEKLGLSDHNHYGGKVLITSGTFADELRQWGGEVHLLNRAIPNDYSIWGGKLLFVGNIRAEQPLTMVTLKAYGGEVDFRTGDNRVRVTTFTVLGEDFKFQVDKGSAITVS